MQSRKPPPRMLRHIRSEKITPNMLRVTLGGHALEGFPAGHESATLKLLLPNPGQDWNSYIASLNGEGAKPLKRTYTLLSHRAAACEIDIDFALHQQPGPATIWASHAKPGDEIAVSGPGRLRMAPGDTTNYLFIADMSSIPALSTNLAQLSQSANCQLIIAITNKQDKQTLQAPPNTRLEWIVHSDPCDGTQPLLEAFNSYDRSIIDTGYYWVAGESSMVRAIREQLAKELNVPQAKRHTSGYWQVGYNEDSFQPIKMSSNFD